MKKNLNIALVHDQLNEFGGAERVLLALSEMWPDAPIYTAFYNPRSAAWQRFKDRDVRTAWVQRIPFFHKLHSPFRFLAPFIWNSFDFRKYDLVISSSSWYVTKGFTQKATLADDGHVTRELCYCHTPPRWLYGYPTAVEWQKYWPVRLYGFIIGHFMRIYDVQAAQRVDQFIANSHNVARRIEKYYRRDSQVIYPPVDERDAYTKKRDNYYLVISRIVGGKGLELAVQAAISSGLHLKIAGQPAGYSMEYQKIRALSESPEAQKSGAQIEFLGYVTDHQLTDLYAKAKAFLALAEDEDFGITPVESMMAGTPVIAFRGGGYVESVVEHKTGVFFDTLSVDGLTSAIHSFEENKSKLLTPEKIHAHALKFSKTQFKIQIQKAVETLAD